MSHWLARSPPLDFSDVTLAFEESAFELLDVTLAREDDRPGVLRPDRSCEFLLYVLYRPHNKLLKLATVWSIAFSVAIELSNNRLGLLWTAVLRNLRSLIYSY